MIAVMPIFCSADWPKKRFSLFPKLRDAIMYTEPTGKNSACIYEENEDSQKEVTDKKENYDKEASPSKTQKLANKETFSHKMAALLFCFYFALQGFLPYSHWLTKGYNTWTQGLYGYSWDMMVHNWRYIHTTVTIVDKKTGRLLHLDPEVWTRSHRWTHHADMVKQFALCVQD
ncbi:Vitamin K-dependent gamma-carboxylase, partial [Stegodyphus mimosarum]